MARIRYLKPEFFTDEDLAELPFKTRLVFAGLWCYADREGRLEDRPKFLKAMIFPYDNAEMDEELNRLANPKRSGRPFILRYEAGGTRYIQILTWFAHQRPHHTEHESEIPPAPPLMEKGMEKGMGMGKQLNPSTELNNGELTVKEPLKLKPKETYGEFKNVLLNADEYQKLVRDFAEERAKEIIEILSAAMASNPSKKYSSHYAVIRNWERRGWMEGKNKRGMLV